LALGEPPQQIEIENKREPVELMSVLRFKGKCGVGAISTIMKPSWHNGKIQLSLQILLSVLSVLSYFVILAIIISIWICEGGYQLLSRFRLIPSLSDKVVLCNWIAI
jgi:hypothetical protein